MKGYSLIFINGFKLVFFNINSKSIVSCWYYIYFKYVLYIHSPSNPNIILISNIKKNKVIAKKMENLELIRISS